MSALRPRTPRAGVAAAAAVTSAAASWAGATFCNAAGALPHAPLRAARTLAHLAPGGLSVPAAVGQGRTSALLGGGFAAGGAAAVSAAPARRGQTLSTAMAAATQMDKSPMQTKIEEIIALNPVVIISKTTCPLWAQAKEVLKKAGAGNVQVIELDKLKDGVGDEIQAYMGELTGATSVPRVFVGRKFIGGGTDSYWCKNYKELIGDPTKHFTDEELKTRDAMLIAGEEPQWCLFDPMVSAYYGKLYQKTKKAEFLKLQQLFLRRALAAITGDDCKFGPWMCCEAYCLHGDKWEPNDNTPLVWTQIDLKMALYEMEQSLLVMV